MADNKPKASIEFDIEDIPVMWHALNIQAATDMMYGQEGHLSSQRSKDRAKALQEKYPLLCQHGMDEYAWLNAVVAARSAKEVSVSQKTSLDWHHYVKSDYKERRPSTERWDTHPITITVDGIPYEITERCNYNEKRLEAFLEMLTQVIPLDCKLHPIAELKL